MTSVLFIILLLIIICFIPFNYPLTKGIMPGVTQENNRGGYLFDYQATTAIKGVAILLILVGHMSGTFSTVVFTPLASAGVSLFLILSGYGLAESFNKKGLSGYWTGKIVRVLIPYAIVITILSVVYGNMRPIKYILEITGVSTSYWYVGYQMKWYLIFFITMLLLPKYRLTIFAVMSVIMYFTLGGLEIEQSGAFLIGILLSDSKEPLSKVSYRRIVYIAIITFCIATLCLGLKQVPVIRDMIGGYTYSFIQLVQNLFYAMFIISFMMLLPKKVSKCSFLIFCGVISYEVYLLHFPFYPQVDGKITLALGLTVASLVASALFSSLNNRVAKLVKAPRKARVS